MVIFKSSSDYFYDEKSNVKNNTVRMLDETDSRLKKLKEWGGSVVDKNYDPVKLFIKIINAETKESFIREIRHVAIYQGICIITWNY